MDHVTRGPCIRIGLLVAVLLGTVMPGRADAAIEKTILWLDLDGTILGATGFIVFPGPTGSSGEGVEFEVGGFSEADLVSIEWELDGSGAVVVLNLVALRGDDPCPTVPSSDCSNVGLSMDVSSFVTGSTSCSAGGNCSASGLLTKIMFGPPTYRCEGFKGPLAKGPVAIKRQRLSWLRSGDLAAPVVDVVYQPPDDAVARGLAPWPGVGGDGDAFVNVGNQWHLLLKLKDFTDPGIYRVTMESGDPSAYRIDPTCVGEFVR